MVRHQGSLAGLVPETVRPRPRASQPGLAQSLHQLAGLHWLGTERDGTLADLGWDVVVVALEPGTTESEMISERVQLLVAAVTHEMCPDVTTPPPDRGVDQDGHRRRDAARWRRVLRRFAAVGVVPCQP